MNLSLEMRNKVLLKLSCQGKTPLTQEICRAKLEYAAGFLNIIAKNITEDSALFALSIIKSIQIYLENTSFLALDKLILKISNKVFIPELFEMVKDCENPEVVAGICFIKLKHLSVVDQRIYKVYPQLNGVLKYKIEKAFDSLLPKIAATPELIQLKIDSKAEGDSVLAEFLQKIATVNIWNNFDAFLIFDKQFKKYFGGKNATSGWNRIISCLKENHLSKAKTLLLSLDGKAPEKYMIIAYSLLSYVHFISLEFQESIFYIDKCLNCADALLVDFLLSCKFLIEREAQMLGPSSKFKIKFDENLDFKKNFENKMLAKRYLNESFERICLFSDSYLDAENLRLFFSSISSKLPGFSILYVFAHNNSLFINDMIKLSSYDVNWGKYSSEFQRIMSQNTQILQMNAVTVAEKKHWWSTRIRLDKDLELLLKDMRSKIEIEVKEKILLIVDEDVANFPFESVFDRPSIRILPRILFRSFQSNKIKSIYYLLDPANNLSSTRKIFSKFLLQKSSKNILNTIKGVEGRPLDISESQTLSNNDLFIYIGHGTGKKYFNIFGYDPRILFLFGCSSCRLLTVKNFKSNGFLLKHMRKNRIIIGNLWDVTDRDLDKFTLAFLEDFFDKLPILESIHKRKNVCKLKYLNSAAVVVYGVFESIDLE